MTPTLDLAQLHAISDAPEAEAPRLVFADWLQERGHGWGELIAVQCGLTQRAALPSNDCVRLLRREHELLATREWWPYDGTGFQAESFERGFPRMIIADSVAGLRTLSAKMPWLPAVQTVVMPIKEGDMALLEGIRLPTRGLQLVVQGSSPFSRGDAERLVDWLAESDVELENFTLNWRFEHDALRFLLDEPRFTRSLTDLSLDMAQAEGETRDPRGLIDRITQLPLRSLSLVDTQNIDGVPTQLSALRPTLTALHVSRAWLDAATVASLEGLRELRVRSAVLANSTVASMLPRQLERISLGDNPIGPSAVQALATLKNVRRLDLSGTLMGEIGTHDIAIAFDKLERLDISSARLKPRAAALLASIGILPSTLVLTISTDEAGEALPALRERFAVVIER